MNSLYRYGCGACDGKDRNKWFNICDKCKDAASKNEEIGSKAKTMLHEIEEKVTSALPPLQTDSGDELKCNDCDVNFPDMRDLRDHYKESKGKKKTCHLNYSKLCLQPYFTKMDFLMIYTSGPITLSK